MFRKLIILFIVAVGFSAATFAQGDQRTRETKIADIIMQLPADNTADFNRLMSELYGQNDPISYLAPSLADPGGNDVRIRYAISGLVGYASRDASLKAPLAQSICNAISKASSDEKRDFLFIQLQYVAGEESIETAAGYLNNSRLSDAAARVLVRIGGDAAGKALLDALVKAKEIPATIVIVQALGELKYAPAATAVASFAGSGNAGLQKAVLYSLSSIADPKTEKILLSAAASANYRYDVTDALGAYLLYLNNLLPTYKSAVAKSAKNLLKATSEDAQAAKTAALELYVLSAGEKAIGEIIAALSSPVKAYREAALAYSSQIASPKMYSALMKKAGNEKDLQRQAELVTAFGNRNDKAALPYVREKLSATGGELRQAAIIAAAKLGGGSVVGAIVKAMNTGDEKVIAVGKTILLSLQSESFNSDVAAAIPQASPAAQAAFLEILAERKAVDQAGTVFAQTLSTDDKVRLAAHKAIMSVGSEKDVPRIASLLNTASKAEEITALQNALYATVSGLPQEKQSEIVLSQINSGKFPERYYNVLAMIGGRNALAEVLKAFRSNNSDTRAAALDALSLWNDEAAILPLYYIAASDPAGSYFDKALTAYFKKTEASNNTPEQKLLMLRKALDIARSPGQKASIINQIGKTGAFIGLLTAGKFLDDHNESVQQAAVQAVRTIALEHPEYYGALVTDIIHKAIAVNKDAEAEYQKQALLKHLETLPVHQGFVSIFNGKDLTGWKGLVENPITRAKMTGKQLAEKQKKADQIMYRDWRVENGLLVFEGSGFDNLCSVKDYGDFEMYVDWRIAAGGDAGIYLRGTPQVQIWDIARTDAGAQVGSGGLYNNQKPINPAKPLVVADNSVGEWNSFYIKMTGEKVTVYLNGQLVTDNTTLENYWDRSQPIFPTGAIELQAHGTRVEYRDIYIREIPRPEPYQVSEAEAKEGFVPMFNGIDMSGWVGNLKDYFAKDGQIVCDPAKGGHGNIYTDKEYSDFIMRFDFQLTPAANNGLGIRAPLNGDAAYGGMELQILDNEADVYKNLQPYQYHGSVYGVIPAKRGFQKPTGEWNTQEVVANGSHITVTLNGTVILDGDIAEASKNFTETADHKNHPGLSNKKGYIGFLGHGSPLAFRNLRIKDLTASKPAELPKKTKSK
jgi:HEAT repeat protein